MKIKKITEKDAEKLLEICAAYVKDTAISFEYDVPTVEELKNRINTISKKFPYINQPNVKLG